MRLLLDTHALLWWLTDDPLLSQPARLALADEANQVLVSAASAWEIATKQRIGKLVGVAPVAQWFSELAAADGFEHLPVTHAHALRAGAFATAHRDPFDRMLAAQAELESLRLVTCDPAMSVFACQKLW
jgi:PIN domain nuclease of toxin-antitoxin system